MKNIKSSLLILVFPLFVSSQSINGKIIDTKGENLIGANIIWLDTTIGAITNEKGEFEILSLQKSDKKLVISFVGYKSDTINVFDETYIHHTLKETNTLGEVTIVSERPDQYISSINVIKTEVITAGELTKSACCDLSGCFGTNASVQPTVTNIITNSTELRILGLSGIYNQILLDGFPVFQGLSFTYGISSIPGNLVENIFVAKGTTSVLQGFESMSGQINVVLKDPNKSSKVFANIYVNSFLEKHFNFSYANSIGKQKKWSNLLAFHSVQKANQFDKNADTFLDLPQVTRYLVFNKLKYRDQVSLGWSSQINLMYLSEKRIGGQTTFDPSTDKGSSSIYGQTVNMQQPTMGIKAAYRFNADHAISLVGDYFFQKQDSWFGQTHYQAQQHSAYANIQYELEWKEKHDFKTGVSLRYFNLNENISFTENPLNKTFAGDYLKQEIISGVFAENIFNFNNDKYQIITGIRLDHHDQFGFYLTPRALLKFQVAEKTILRASVGTGWRTANIFSENINLLASQRDVIFTGQLKPEQALNFGFSIVQEFNIGNVEGFISTDLFQTHFQNQIFPDYDTDPTKATINNFTGTSVSNGFQTDLNLIFYELVTAKIAYNFLEVFRNVDDEKIILPFIPLHKILAAISYKPENDQWHIDVNLHWFGEQHLPNTSTLPADLQRSDKSDDYATMNIQITKSWKKFELYAGCENVFDFIQQQPIISWQDPFSPYFDTSSVWGPTRGREFYAGLRFKLK